MTNYNYDEFSTGDYDFDTEFGPDVGDKAPDFALTTASGETKNLLDLDEHHQAKSKIALWSR